MAVSAVWYASRLDPVTPPVIRVALNPGDGLWFDNRAPALAVSRSGAKVAWAACNEAGCQLYLRPVDQLLGQPIPLTAGGAAPFFSPDERWLGFFADGKLQEGCAGRRRAADHRRRLTAVGCGVDDRRAHCLRGINRRRADARA